MKLIIAEKPSLGRAIMSSLGEKFTQSGPAYRSDNYYVVPLRGHILELQDFEDYPENEGKSMWSLKNLPYFPAAYEHKVSSGSRDIYNCIRKLLRDPQVTEVIHCGDADREGQIIVDLVLEKLGNTKPVTRPFIKSTTKAGLQEAFRLRRPNEEFQSINAEGKTREFADFDFGKNLSRYASKKAGVRTGLNVGRVIGAIVTEIYRRDLEIENFVPRNYFKVESDLQIKLTSKREFNFGDAGGAAHLGKTDHTSNEKNGSPLGKQALLKTEQELPKTEQEAEAQAKAWASRLNAADAVVTDLDRQKQTRRAPRLFSQTDLQGAANRRFGFSPKRTLKAAQDLYEKGMITYPRTNTSFMAQQDRGMVAGILRQMGPEFEMKPVFDDSKVDGHSAITPTGSYRKVTGDEEKIYMMILNRFRAVFCKEPCTVLKTTLTIDCLEGEGSRSMLERFKVSGEVSLTQGWKKYEQVTEKETVLPDLGVGDLVDHDFKPQKAQTKPPAHHTVTSLGKWMQNPFRKSEEDEVDYARMLSGMEIGTEATRAAIIDKAIAKNYIDLTKNTYTIQPEGRFLVETCQALGIDMSSVKTAQMGRDTKAVARGEKTCQEVLEAVRAEITAIIGQAGDKSLPASKESAWDCPRCGKKLQESLNKLECQCGYSLWKIVAKKRLDEESIGRLLAGKKTGLLKGFRSKAGRSFSAYLIPGEDGSTQFEFPPKPVRESLGACPKCGNPVCENKKAYGCSGWKPGGKGCDFAIWKYDRALKVKISPEQARALLKGEQIKKAAGTLILTEEGLRLQDR